MDKSRQLKRLESKFASAISLFNKTIVDLEKVDKEYHTVKEELKVEIQSLQATESELDGRIARNNKLLTKLKSFVE